MKKKLTDSQREAKRARDRRYREKKRAEAKAAKVAPGKNCGKKCAAKTNGHKTINEAIKNAKTVVFTGEDVDIIACVIKGIMREIIDIIGRFSLDIRKAVICRLAKH